MCAMNDIIRKDKVLDAILRKNNQYLINRDEKKIFLGGDQFSNCFKVRHKVFGIDCVLKAMDLFSICNNLNKSEALQQALDQSLGNSEESNTLIKIKNRFVQEARFFIKLNHRNIVRFYDAGSVTIPYEKKNIECSYFTMDYIEGPDLEKYLLANTPLDMGTVFKISSGILSAIKHIHENNKIYGNINSIKIIIEESTGEPMLIDSGMSKDISIDATVFPFTEKQMYLSFEQLKGKKNVGVTTDIFSFGLVLYEMVTGEKLCKMTAFEIEYDANDLPIIELKRKNPLVPDGLESIIKKALAYTPGNRYQNAHSLLDDLKNVLVSKLPPVLPGDSKTIKIGKSLESFYDEFSQIKKEGNLLRLCLGGDDMDSEDFELNSTLGKGAHGFVYFSICSQKISAIRLSYEDSNFTGRIDNTFFLKIICPSRNIKNIFCGKRTQENKILFDREIYASVWEKADSTLKDKIGENVETGIRWFKQFLEGIRILHSENKGHFDIKPANLFLVGENLKIGDFEYIKNLGETERPDIGICGTPGYMAPEVFDLKHGITHKVDIYSAGVTFAELFTGLDFHVKCKRSDDGIIVFSKEEENECEKLMGSKYISTGFSNTIFINAFRKNFKIYYSLKKYLNNEINSGKSEEKKCQVYKVLIEMMAFDPQNRPGADEILLKIKDVN
jgi:serine/threonine protein kinase